MPPETSSPSSSSPRRRAVGAAPAGAPQATGKKSLRPLPEHLLGKLAATDTRPSIMLLETLLLPGIALALGVLLHPQDPLWSEGDFPWAWLAPVIVALRYGPLAGLGGAVVLLAGWLLINFGHYDRFPQLFFLGGLILVLLVGEFSSLWQARTRRAESVQLYLDQRLEHLVRQYYLLRLSHDRLEQELIGRPMSMRDALATLQSVGGEEHDPVQGAQTLLRLLAQYCQLESAALHAATEDEVQAEPVARIGSNTELLDTRDPLVVQALETRKLCHISQLLEHRQQTRYLAVAPLLDLGGEIYGLLVIEDMPFFSLQDENLQTINLLLGYYTDGLAMQTLARPIVERIADCPADFAFEVQRLSHMRDTTRVPSIVVALEFLPRAIERGLPAQIERLKRELDESWLIAGPERQVLALLMPLGDLATAEGYINRLENWSQQKSGQPLAESGIFPHVVPLEGEPLAVLEQLHRIAHA
ncbi:GAF domain-containing protein [Acidovorax sp. GBBC 3334]|uniref:PelD GGDEF domain-containing protein n=1 Tax=unclassified Acidovorax TaxID=2684926 RepID=UPI0023039476|nr:MULTISPECIES: PelD GGDEF domain-containing protein [unclassified Acidovorax]MDA8454432.1 GAF domain-containing protein [Acidovorax sp. GBBC 3334]MDA8519543.1 GAF domain-containing protein [Acidovorax sp. NCPPB 4044]